MLKVGDTIIVEKNFFNYVKGETKKRSIPEGVYEVVEAKYAGRGKEGPYYGLSKIGTEEEPLGINGNSLLYSNKWRKL